MAYPAPLKPSTAPRRSCMRCEYVRIVLYGEVFCTGECSRHRLRFILDDSAFVNSACWGVEGELERLTCDDWCPFPSDTWTVVMLGGNGN